MTRLLLIGIGLILSLFGLNDLFTTHARFVNSNPAPGTSVYAPPTVVTVTFSEELAPQSEISVVSTVTLLPSGETSYSGGGKASTTSSIDVYDPQHRSLKAVLLLELPNGLYRVDWTATAEKTKAQRFGAFYSGAGMPVPDHILKEGTDSLRKTDFEYEEGSRASTLVGGFILVLLGLAWNHLPRRA